MKPNNNNCDTGFGIMTAEDRRKSILHFLKSSEKPVSASTLASNFKVSRQIIVGDIALIRAQGISIYATTRGYTLHTEKDNVNERTITCKHDGSLMEKELQICVDNGCRVLNVIVTHPIYGHLIGELQLSSRYEIEQFIRRVKEHEAHSLCELTNDVHQHTLDCPNQEAFERVCEELRQLGILID